MPIRDAAPTGAPCWVDLMSSDPERARGFYGGLLGWTLDEPAAEFGGYANFRKDGVLVAGLMGASSETPVPDVWSVHLATEDASKTLEAAEAHGGRVVVPAMQVGALGTMSMVLDPSGAAVGAWQPGTHLGFGAYGEPGTPSWFELMARDFASAVAFYREVFGWTTHVVSDTDEFRYTTYAHGDEWLAGIMDASAWLPEGVPSHWTVYFGVEDADAAAARTVELGGAVLAPAEDTPYGRIAEVADPMGARFRLVAATESMPAR